MFRLKLVLSLVFVFAAVGAVVHVNLTDAARDAARTRLEGQLTTAREAVQTRRRLNRFATLAKARQVAAWPQLARVLSRTPASFAGEDGVAPAADEVRYQIHRAMNEEVLVWQARFKALESGAIEPTAELHDVRRARPEVFAIVDAKGIGVAKGGDMAWFGPERANLGKAHPALVEGLANGRAFVDVWFVDDTPTQIAVAPIRQGEHVVGAVVLGFRLTDSEAKIDQARVGVDVVYFTGPRVRQSSSLDPMLERMAASVVEAQSLHTRTTRGALELELNATRYLAQVAQIEGNASTKGVGFLVLGNLDAAVAAAEAPLTIVLLATGLGFVLCLGLLLAFFQQFMRPLERIDQGIMELIAGNRDHWFTGSGRALPSTMAQNLNILVCILTGRPLPDDEDGSQLARALERIERVSASARPIQPPEET